MTKAKEDKPDNEPTIDATPKPKKKTKATPKVPGLEAVESVLGSDYGPVLKCCEKFSRRHGVKMVFISKFMSFKLMRQEKHVDWITFKDLMKVYDSRVLQPPGASRKPQRPGNKKQIY